MQILNGILIFGLCFACVYSMKSCISNDACEEGECCVFMSFIRGFCHTLGDEGDHCIMEPAKTKYGEKNLFGCPCKEGLKCTPETIVKEEDGKTIMKNLSCKQP
ncbi:U9-ctenitoxin-Pr1a-like [Parasteatoda tepidariorum]|uniref:U9-ctenitoxin-Pr1a-like n=1 Tax=Parasteatoda tepidariorum TaxID=114398 RepID=UPI001C71EE3C|nr:U9-ctenitoxin-Pr1a-like [Parasteatoda tepidariorum]